MKEFKVRTLVASAQTPIGQGSSFVGFTEAPKHNKVFVVKQVLNKYYG